MERMQGGGTMGEKGTWGRGRKGGQDDGIAWEGTMGERGCCGKWGKGDVGTTWARGEDTRSWDVGNG